MRLEHINLTVADLDRSTRFYGELLGLRTRWRGHTSSGEPAAHVGTDDWYIALFQAGADSRHRRVAFPDYLEPGINHFGILVDDLEAARERLVGLGATIHFETGYDPGRRLYFRDPDGIEVELVSYTAAREPQGAR